jgi:hypothetical protein
MAMWIDQFSSYLTASDLDVEEIQKEKTVVIIPGIDHSDFCPGFDVPGDIIPSEVNSDEALERISKATASWLNKVWGTASEEDSKYLSSLYMQSIDFLRPYFSALDIELMYHGMHYAGLGGSYSPLCEKAQMILAGLEDEDADRVQISRGCDHENFEESRR